MSNKDFWDISYNPVKGCFNSCKYCYARRIVKRCNYAGKVASAELKYRHKNDSKKVNAYKIYDEYQSLFKRIKQFKPTFFEYVFAKKLRKKPTMYFFSMSDPAYWKQEWYERIATKIAANMQHTFVVLTKQPEVYGKYTFPHNTILGASVTKNIDVNKLELLLAINMRNNKNKTLISFEPIQEKLDELLFNIMKIYKADWLHVGQESGNRRDRVIATREMIEPFFTLKDIPVFMKNNLAGIVQGRELRKEFPEL